MTTTTLAIPTGSGQDQDDDAVLPRIDGTQPPRPPAQGSVEEKRETARAVGYEPGIADGPVETARDIERLIYARLGWEL